MFTELSFWLIRNSGQSRVDQKLTCPDQTSKIKHKIIFHFPGNLFQQNRSRAKLTSKMIRRIDLKIE